RPRLSHMPRTIASVSALLSSGIASCKLARARLVMPSRGPIQRPIAPPSAEAQSSGNRPSTPPANAAIAASRRWFQRAGGDEGSATICGMSRQDRREQGGQRCLVLPADFYMQDIDADAPIIGQPDSILIRGDEQRVLPVGELAQANNLARGERVVIGESLFRDDFGAEPAQR